MLDIQHPGRAVGGLFHRLDAEWAAQRRDADVRVAVADWLMADRLADAVAAVTGAVSDSQVRTAGLAQLLAALQPGSGRLTDERTDAVLRALLRRAAGRDRSATLAARIVVQAMILAAVRITRSQARPFGGRTFDAIGHVTVSALFEVARSGRIHTRPGRPAANLALDTLRYVCRELAADREARAEDLDAAEELPDRAPGPGRMAEAAEVRTAATTAGLTPAGPAWEAEATRAAT